MWLGHPNCLGTSPFGSRLDRFRHVELDTGIADGVLALLARGHTDNVLRERDSEEYVYSGRVLARYFMPTKTL